MEINILLHLNIIAEKFKTAIENDAFLSHIPRVNASRSEVKPKRELAKKLRVHQTYFKVTVRYLRSRVCAMEPHQDGLIVEISGHLE